MAGLLLAPAIVNGFPLVFPDSGTYLGIATGHDYALDRSSVYGLLLKPFVTAVPGLAGLWLAIAAQTVAVAAILMVATHALLGRHIKPADILLAFVPMLLTSLPWHPAQFMPDAFTGPLVLLVCVGVTRPVTAPGSPLLWLAVLLLAMTHYTHVVLLPIAAAAGIAAQLPLGLGWREGLRRFGIAAGACGAAIALLAVANGAILGRATMSPVGPFFLFARLNEDGLSERWLEWHCGRDAPARLCDARANMPRNSQTMLWGGAASPVARHIWAPANDAERWRWIDMMGAANRGAIAGQPVAFATSALRAASRQFVSFRALDDECPAGCGRNPAGGIVLILRRDRPAALPALMASRQLRDTIPKAAIRAVTTPVSALALALLPLALGMAWRRRDRTALAMAAGIAAAIVSNAAVAGALSGVHDRYQSRIVWLAPLLLLLLALRWRRPACPLPAPGA